MINCERCGASTPGIFLNTENGVVALCPKCSGTTGYCATCAHGPSCRFEADSSITEPKIITKSTVIQTPNGPMQMQQQVRNPAREEKTCYECPCWAKEDKVCNAMDAHTCENYQLTTFWRR